MGKSMALCRRAQVGPGGLVGSVSAYEAPGRGFDSPRGLGVSLAKEINPATRPCRCKINPATKVTWSITEINALDQERLCLETVRIKGGTWAVTEINAPSDQAVSL